MIDGSTRYDCSGSGSGALLISDVALGNVDVCD